MIVENLEDEAIVISGVSGKFPNSNNVDKLIENLLNSVDCISENHTRWPKVPRRIGSMPEITKLGNIFFGVSTKTEKTMDPVSKLLLPSAVEAISDAGLNFSEIRRTNIGVFGALSYQESDENTIYQKAEVNMWIRNPRIRSLSNRVSFTIDALGTSCTIESECVRSAIGLRKAFESIKSGDCEAAIVDAGILAMLSTQSYQFKQLVKQCNQYQSYK
ncbi:hypothetical protein M0802_011996 [Mischocyttarus mexicanus]|nr:hypothetical protein M0802_011996 [Mischocyttarus mexicanus]